MTIERSNEHGELTNERLEVFEADIGCTLPDDYREYLLTHNGGRPVPRDFDLDVGGPSSLEIMYGLHNGPQYVR